MIEVGKKLFHHGVKCENGHVITLSLDSLEDYFDKFCQECGSKTITSCPKCDNPILGWSYNPRISVIAFPEAQPYCRFCGKPLPWTLKKKKIEKRIDSASQLTDEEKQAMKNNLSEIVKETRQTKTAAKKFTEGLKKVGKQAAKEIRSLTVDIASETGKKVILHYAGMDNSS